MLRLWTPGARGVWRLMLLTMWPQDSVRQHQIALAREGLLSAQPEVCETLS